MPTRKQLLRRAEEAGIDVRTDAKKAEIEAEVAKSAGSGFLTPTAEAQDRSLDPGATGDGEGDGEDAPETPTFTKDYVLALFQESERGIKDLRNNFLHQARQVGISPDGDVTHEVIKQRDGSTRVRFSMPSRRTAR